MATKTTKKPRKKVDAVKKLIDDRWGEGTLRYANDPSLEITRIPTGIEVIDDLFGGGLPRNRHLEIFGDYGLGKTSLALYAIANAQRLKLKCAYIDAEKSFDPTFAQKLGVNLKRLAYHEQETGNRCVDFMEMLLRSGEYDILVLDSIAALLPIAEADKPMEAASMGTAQARLMSAALRKLTTANKKTVIIFINQTREAIGVMFGNRAVTSGGRALGFYAGIRLEITRSETIKANRKVMNPKSNVEGVAKVVVGHRCLARTQKSKVSGAKQFDTTTFVFDYELGGIDPVEDLIYLGRKYRCVRMKGKTWWVAGYDEEAQLGRPRFKTWLRRNVAVQEDLLEQIHQAQGAINHE